MIWKPLLLAMCLISSAALAQPLLRTQLEGREGIFRDPEYGLEISLPNGLQVGDGARWGELETTLFLSGPKGGHVFVVNYQLLPEGLPNDRLNNALISEFQRKTTERRNDIRFPRYSVRESSVQQRTLRGAAALMWSADYQKAGVPWCEMFTLVARETVRVAIFVSSPASSLVEVKDLYEKLVNSVTLGKPSILGSLDPGIVEARRLFRDGMYTEAMNAFRKAFARRPGEGHELVAAAAAAAAAGDRMLALAWIKSAIERGWAVTNRVQWDPRFASLGMDEEWRTIVNSLGPNPGPGHITSDKTLQAELLQIHEDDQKYRALIEETEKTHGASAPELKALFEKMAEQDRINLGKVEHILSTKGWIGPEEVGEKASEAIFLAIQHADPSTQKRYLPMMREAVERRKAPASSLALLEDRVMLSETGFQLYGTQVQRDTTTGTYKLLPLSDPAGVDARRSAAGLPPLTSYLRRWNIEWGGDQIKSTPSNTAPPN